MKNVIHSHRCLLGLSAHRNTKQGKVEKKSNNLEQQVCLGPVFHIINSNQAPAQRKIPLSIQTGYWKEFCTLADKCYVAKFIPFSWMCQKHQSPNHLVESYLKGNDPVHYDSCNWIIFVVSLGVIKFNVRIVGKTSESHLILSLERS